MCFTATPTHAPTPSFPMQMLPSIRAPSLVHTRRQSGRMSANSMDWGSLDPHELFFDPSSGQVDMPMHYSLSLPQRLCVWSRDVWFRIVGWLRG
ncbi:hypothetical protein JB92DRAFT_2935072 [Gautieria morchelliformis]|nr:hypothetical protein JB92DRAFT_2935072 [Gautieria morchelliformis]